MSAEHHPYEKIEEKNKMKKSIIRITLNLIPSTSLVYAKRKSGRLFSFESYLFEEEEVVKVDFMKLYTEMMKNFKKKKVKSRHYHSKC